MEFLNPYLLWGALGISVPIVIHLLNRFRYRQVDWAAMELLRRAMVARSQRLRIEDLLLLVLRCLAILLLALAFARFTLTPSGAQWVGGGADVGAVVAVDGSFSMTHRPGVQSRFDRALERTGEVLRTLPTGSPLSVLIAGSRPRLALRGVRYDAGRAAKALEDAEPFPERLQLETTLQEAITLLDEIKAPVRELYIVTDAQASSWESVSEKAQEQLRNIASRGRIFLLTVGSETSENLAVSGFEFASGGLRTGATARYVASVTNHGESLEEDVAVSLLLEDLAVDQRLIDRIAPGASVEVPLFARFATGGCLRLTAKLDDDALPIDNRRHAVCEVREQVRVLCVDGDPAPDAYDSETGYLVTALTVSDPSEERPPAFVNAIPWPELAAQRLSDYEIVLLANIPDVPIEQAAALRTFVSSGGGLVIFLGENVSPDLIGERLRVPVAPILPAAVGETRGEVLGEAEGYALQPSAVGHPLWRALRSFESGLIDEARIFRYFQLTPDEGSQVVIELAGANAPFLVEKSLGQGTVLLVASTADDEWGNLVSHPAYPVLLQQTVTYLTRRAHETPVVVSRPASLPLPPRLAAAGGGTRAGSEIELRVPGAERATTASIARSEGGEPTIELPPADQAGFFEVRAGGEGGPSLSVAVNVDTAESDVKSLSSGEISSSLGALPVRVVTESDDLVDIVRATRVGRELWWELVLVALGVLALESFLARRFSRRKSGESEQGTG